MTGPHLTYGCVAQTGEEPRAAGHSSLIPLSDPDITRADIAAVDRVLCSQRLSSGEVTEQFEAAFAAYLGRNYAVAVSSGTIGLLLCLKACGIGAGDEVVASSHSYRETAHAISLAGARPVFADIDYWSGTLAPQKVEERITPQTRAILAANINGHPAAWSELRDIASRHNLLLLEDSTEAIASRYKGQLVGTFGDVAVFDLSQPSLLTCGEGAIVVTDDEERAVALRRHRSPRLGDRSSVSVSSAAPYQAGMSDLSAALGLGQLRRIDEILERRRLIEQLYATHMQSFEGIKPPYIECDATEVNWFSTLSISGPVSRAPAAMRLSRISASSKSRLPPTAVPCTFSGTISISDTAAAICR